MDDDAFAPIWSRLTPIQRRMVEVLSDGAFHYAEELHQLLSDDLGPQSNIQPHLTGIRRLLLKVGMGLVTQRCGRTDTSYVLVVLPKPAVSDLGN